MQEGKDIQMMERIRLFTEHPESITEQQAQEWLADEEFMSLLNMHLDAQRAFVDEPDAHEAFKRFKDNHGESALPKRHTMVRFIKPLLLAAAACTVILFGFSYYNKYKVEQREQQMLHAEAINDDLTFYVGDKAVQPQQVAKKDRPSEADDLFIVKGDEITVNPKALTDKDVYEKTTLVVPEGKVAKVNLPDNSVIYLNAGSSVIFPPKFAEGKPRVVRLKGEAYFAVTHDEACPFIVLCGDMQTTVLGTEFNIHCYEGETPHVTLVKGSVRVATDKQEQILKPGEDAIINGQSISKQQVYLDPIVAWKEGVLYFNEITLKEILNRLARTFNMDLVMNDSTGLDDCIHLVVDKEEGIREIVERLNMLSFKQVRVEGKRLIVE